MYHPDLYDLVTPASFRGDAEWYRAKARECGGPVLELGAGTGRITLQIAQNGVVVHALDADGAMRAVLRRKLAALPAHERDRVVVINGDMRTFTSTERFPLVIAPFRAFLHNLTEQDQLACLNQIREHLAPRGRFAFNVFHPSLEIMAHHVGAMAGVWRWVGTFPRADGGFVVRSDANRYDTTRQLVHSQHRYDEYGPDGTLSRSSLHDLRLAYLYPPDLRRLLTQAGFRSIQIYGGFDGRPFENDTDELVIEASVE
ncbi:MAG TPA: class I SAM-dependent methyltransferase [Vicinamibacterales bacterium]|nr:class I SAM-dependent methyltransferase [Vicinamibacterales bacterium]